MAQSIDDIEKEYDLKIAAQTDPEVVRVLQNDKNQAKLAWLQAQLREKDREAWRKDALKEFPNAAQAMTEITGETEGEIKASAKTVHDRIGTFLAEQSKAKEEELATAKKELEELKKKQAWGGPSGGAATRSVDQLQADVDKWNGLLGKYNDGTLTRPEAEWVQKFRMNMIWDDIVEYVDSSGLTGRRPGRPA